MSPETDTSSLRAVPAYQSCDDLVVTSDLISDRELVNYNFPQKEKKTPEAALFLDIEKVLLKLFSVAKNGDENTAIIHALQSYIKGTVLLNCLPKRWLLLSKSLADDPVIVYD